jgi:hypothetical protein
MKGVAFIFHGAMGERIGNQTADDAGEKNGQGNTEKKFDKNTAHACFTVSGRFHAGVEITYPTHCSNPFNTVSLMTKFFPQIADMDIDTAIK